MKIEETEDIQEMPDRTVLQTIEKPLSCPETVSSQYENDWN